MASRIEEPVFDVIDSYVDFEIRRYVDTVQAQVRTSGRAGEAASGGFRRVARYIFGGNAQQTSIAMTAPVSMWEEDGSGWLAFTMPRAYSIDSLPQPNDEDVRLVARAGSTVAVMKFSGRNTPGKADRVENKLRAAMEREGHQPNGPAVLALYDNPWTTLPFLRRNELHIELAAHSSPSPQKS